MDFGRLRHRVTIQTLTETADGRGGFNDALVIVVRRVPAKVEQLSGRELDRAMQIDPRARVAVALRYHQGIKAEQTLVYHSFEGDRSMEIVAPPQVEELDRSLTLLCGEAPA